MDRPSYPQSDDVDRDQDHRNGVNWGTMIVLVVLALLFVTVVILHLTGVVGPRGH
jgi:hypothetical protein